MNLKLLKSIKVMLYTMMLGMAYLFWTPIKYGKDPDFRPYINAVKKLSKGNLSAKGLHIHYTNFRPKALGTCFTWRNEILINKKHWQKMTHYDRILLMAHEITHCQKGIKHLNGLTYWGCAKHYMHWQDTGMWCNRIRFKEYVKQMQEI